MSVAPGQLCFEIFEASLLAGDLVDRRRMPQGQQAGAERLLRALVRGGLDRDALVPAARLVLELDRAGREATSA